MLATKLRILRDQANMKQSELAEALGIATSTLSGYELGNTYPNSEIIKRICEHFSISADWLLGLESMPKIETKSDIIKLVETITFNTATIFPATLKHINEDEIVNRCSLVVFPNKWLYEYHCMSNSAKIISKSEDFYEKWKKGALNSEPFNTPVDIADWYELRDQLVNVKLYLSIGEE